MSGFDFSAPVILLGAISGLSYALLAVGLSLVYRSSRFINFAQGAMGLFAAGLAGLVIDRFSIPYWLAFVGALLLGAGLGAGTEMVVVRRLNEAPRVLATVATLGVGQFLLLWALAMNGRGLQGGRFPQPPFMPEFDVGPLFVSQAASAILILTPLLLIGLAAFLRYARYGLAIRSAAANPDTTALAGADPDSMAMLSWAMAGLVAAFSAMFFLPVNGATTADSLGPDFLLRGLAAAAVGRFTNLPVTVAAALGIGIAEAVFASKTGTGGYTEIAMLLLVLGGIAFQKRSARSADEESWEVASVTHWLPDKFREVWSIRNLGRIAGVSLAVLAALVPVFVSNRTSFVLITVLSFAIVGVAIGLLTGLGGQLSLGQFAFGAVGAAVSIVILRESGNLVLGILAAALVAAVAGTLVGLPALRVRGVLLGVATLAFALATSAWLMRQSFMFGNGISPDVPVIAGKALDTSRSYYYVPLVALFVVMWLAANLRSRSFGRKLVAVRDNEDAARVLMVSPAAMKLKVYAIAGAIAGIGGAVLAHANTQVSAAIFPVQASIDVVALTVIGGISSLIGPVIGAIYLIGIPRLYQVDLEALAALSAAWLALILIVPSGIVGALRSAVDRLIDALARRAGIDPETARAEELHAASAQTSSLELRSAATALGEGHRESQREGGEADTPMLEVAGITKRYGGIVAVHDVSFAVTQGQTVGLIGPNGAGKTTVFEMISGFVRPDAGSITYKGTDLGRSRPEQRSRIGLVRSFQNATMFPTMTLREVVMLAREKSRPATIFESTLGLSKRDRQREAEAREVIALFGLSPFEKLPIGSLSTGTRRVAELAVNVALEPELLLLDEPSAGISQADTEALAEVLTRTRDAYGMTLVVIEHDMPLLSEISDRMIAMEVGALIASGTPAQVQADPAVVSSYLGIGG